MERHKHPRRFWRHALSFPFIWIVLVPFLLLDVVVELYHRTCFPLYGLTYVKRRDYIRLDRYKLPYLSVLDKINCLYCEYGNGLLHYVSRIAGDTEKYWCGVRHENYPGFKHPKHHADFMKHGDENAYKKCKMQKKK